MLIMLNICVWELRFSIASRAHRRVSTLSISNTCNSSVDLRGEQSLSKMVLRRLVPYERRPIDFRISSTAFPRTAEFSTFYNESTNANRDPLPVPNLESKGRRLVMNRISLFLSLAILERESLSFHGDHTANHRNSHFRWFFDTNFLFYIYFYVYLYTLIYIFILFYVFRYFTWTRLEKTPIPRNREVWKDRKPIDHVWKIG